MCAPELEGGTVLYSTVCGIQVISALTVVTGKIGDLRGRRFAHRLSTGPSLEKTCASAGTTVLGYHFRHQSRHQILSADCTSGLYSTVCAVAAVQRQTTKLKACEEQRRL
jgi:hypothetical protein